VLNVVELGEEAIFFGRPELLEFFQRLPPKIAAVDQKEDTASPSVFHETVDEIAGRVGLAAAAGHLDERARAAIGQGYFQVPYRCDLGWTKPFGNQRREAAEPGTECRSRMLNFPREPRIESVGLVKAKN